MLSRRGFLVGTGGLLTAAFVNDAQSFVLRNDQPLLVTPPQIAQTLFWYDNDEQGLMLTIGEWDVCPPPPTWREFFVSEGVPHGTEPDADRIWTEHNIEPADYDEQVDGLWWETRFDLKTGPTAKAYHLLRKLDLGPTLKRSTEQSHLVFREGDLSNQDSRWVDARNHLTLSLLQARLIDLKLPISIAKGA
ncbi:hypothetical protein [Rhizobium sp. RAF56]|uniref:hypothetical protein n=1 Tax=Rhizobium sp. RAF56 TaxID=3233062 RepID=UPI003F9E61F9